MPLTKRGFLLVENMGYIPYINTEINRVKGLE